MKRPAIPEPLSRHPTYPEAAGEISRYQAALFKVETRIAEIEAQLRTAPSEEVRDEGHVKAALQFAESGVAARTTIPVHLHEEHLTLRNQAEALQRAIDAKSRVLATVRSEVSAHAVAKFTEYQADLRKRFADVLRELGAVMDEELQLVADLERQGYAVHFAELAQWPLLGSLRDGDSVISMRLREISTSLA